MSSVIKIKNWIHVLAIIILFSLNASAQETVTDSTATTNELDSTASAPAAPKYERFKMNIDSITQLVTYKAIVDQSETTSDSFYLRAKRWANNKYNLAKNKKMILLDKPNEKLVLKTKFACQPAGNQYQVHTNGSIVFNLTLIFKDEKYKYIIDNIYYEPELDPLDKDNKEPVETTPFEYYVQVKHKKKASDAILKGADNDINKLIHEIMKALENPKESNEDDF